VKMQQKSIAPAFICHSQRWNMRRRNRLTDSWHE
jgi:hypothetical protein